MPGETRNFKIQTNRLVATKVLNPKRRILKMGPKITMSIITFRSHLKAINKKASRKNTENSRLIIRDISGGHSALSKKCNLRLTPIKIDPLK